MKERASILVIEDTPATLSFLVRLLDSVGYQVQAADSGRKGLDMATASPPDLILLDVRMSEMNGVEVCRNLKARPDTKDVPVILISAYAEAEERIGGLDVGAADYVTKPFLADELLARIRTQLTLHHTLRLLREKAEVIERTNEQLQAEVEARLQTENELLRSLDRAERSRRALLGALEDAKRGHQELQEARAFLDSIVENIPSMLFIKDAKDLRATRINRAVEDFLGISRNEILGKTPGELFAQPRAELCAATDREALERREVVEVPEEPVLTRSRGERILQTKKVPIFDAEGRPQCVLAVAVDITEKKRAEDEIASLTERLKDILATVPEIIMEVDNDKTYTWANDAGLRFFGSDVVGQPADYYFVGDQDTYRAVQPLFTGEEDAVYTESLQRRCDGAQRLLAWWCRPLKNASGEVRGALSSARDITDARRMEEERKRLEEQVRTTQKMEAIGMLAGGVAHDFNNLLCVLQSYTEFALRGIQPDDPVKDDLLAVKRASERAATLTRQLLAFGRRQVLRPVVLNLNDVAQGMEKMLRRILGEDIEFVQVLEPDLGMVRADQGQLEQVLMNLVVNARDAMPDGGQLRVTTHNVELGPDSVEGEASLPPGPYVQLQVSDTGCGMDEMTVGRIFEPFFTTKDKGKGTGLGLATAYGIVKQSKGGISVASEVGQGTTFSIYLPRELSASPVVLSTYLGSSKAQGTETILVVEDEDELRSVSRRALEGAGYSVLSAADGEEALRVADDHAGAIHLLLTDVVMPKLGGRALAGKLKRKRPDLVVLYMSGYTDDAIIRHDLLDAGVQLLAKPFTGSDLTQKVREVLDGVGPTSTGTHRAVREPASSARRPKEILALAAVSESTLGDLCVAAMTARHDELVEIIERLRTSEPDLAGLLQQRADCFDYEAILNLVRRGNAGNPAK